MNDPKPQPMLREPGAPFTGDPYAPQKQMPEYAQRMAMETTTAVRNLQKLSEFISGNPLFQSLPVFEQQLMVEQRDQMREYARTLSLRYMMALLDHG